MKKLILSLIFCAGNASAFSSVELSIILPDKENKKYIYTLSDQENAFKLTLPKGNDCYLGAERTPDGKEWGAVSIECWNGKTAVGAVFFCGIPGIFKIQKGKGPSMELTSIKTTCN